MQLGRGRVGWGGGSLPQTTLRGAGLDDISWNKAAREPQSGSLLTERVRRPEQPAVNATRRKFQYVTRRKVVAVDTLSHLSSVVPAGCAHSLSLHPPPALNTPRVFILIGFGTHANIYPGSLRRLRTMFNTGGRF